MTSKYSIILVVSSQNTPTIQSKHHASDYITIQRNRPANSPWRLNTKFLLLKKNIG